MRALLIVWLALLTFAVGCNSGQDVKIFEIEKGDSLQDRGMTERMFADMEARGVSPKQPLLWGYFFFGEQAPLQQVWDRLNGGGYTLVRLEATEAEPGEPATSILHIEMVEVHTVDSLLERNRELLAIASPLGVEYDGMDVGPPEKL